MLGSVRYFLTDLWHCLGRHKLLATASLVLLVAAGLAGYLLASPEDDSAPSPAPEVVVREVAVPEQTEELGFPAFATKNTTRVASPSPVSTAAAVALAVFPSTGGVPGPDAVSLIEADDWPAGIAAASLVAEPVGAPVLLAEDGELGELTENALRELDPQGSAGTDGRQILALGTAAPSDDSETFELAAANPAELAAEIRRLRTRLGGEPEHIVVASSDDPGYAMPAAGWAARSGDPVLFVGRETVPAATAKALERYEGTPVYVLGPASAIAPKTLSELEDLAPTAERVGAAGVLANSIEFARYASGSFGWNINDPGHGFVIATGRRPADGGAAAPLSASGTWGPLLVTERADAVPAELRGYLLDLKPGYDDDPTRALYNHVWLIGDTDALSVDFQVQIDQLAELAPVTSGSGATGLVPGPGTVESSPDQAAPDRDQDRGQENQTGQQR
jgi:hypothetical protein